jgi:hypothetical protein
VDSRTLHGSVTRSVFSFPLRCYTSY